MMLRRSFCPAVVALLASLGLSPLVRAEPIQVPAAFMALSKPFPADWKSQRFAVTVTSPATGGKSTRVRVEKSSGDARADRIAVDYVNHLLKLKPDLRAKNATNQLDFPLVVDAGTTAPPPVASQGLKGDVPYQKGLKGYDISPPNWPRNIADLSKGGRLVVRVVFGRDGKVDKVSLLKSSGSDFLDGFAARWALSHWKCAPENAGTAMVVPVGLSIGMPGGLRDTHQPTNRETSGFEPSYGRSPTR